MSKPSSLSEAIDESKNSRTLIEDEEGKLIMKKDLSHWERVRIFLNRWWVFALLLLAASQIVQAVLAVLQYFKNP